MSLTTRMATSAITTALALSSLTTACQKAMSAPSPVTTAHVHTAAAAEVPAIHGMLVVGSQTLYVSHLPMFHAPHDAQAIAAVQMTDATGDVRARLAKDRASSGEKVYTLVPAPDRLGRLFTVGNRYQATLYRGHFERGGTPLLTHVTVTVQQVVHQRTFTPQPGTGMQPKWIVFGTPQETFAAHWISAPPDLDQVVQVKVPAEVDAAWLAKGGIADVAAPMPWKAGTTLTAKTPNRVLPVWSLRVASAIYTETGDLAE